MKNFRALVLILLFTFGLIPAISASDTETWQKVDRDVLKMQYQNIEALLQFFYRVDANLPPIKDSKQKRFKYLKEKAMSAWPIRQVTEQYVSEYWGDPDYFVWELKKSHEAVIMVLENWEHEHSYDADIKKIDRFLEKTQTCKKQAADNDSPFGFIKSLLEIDGSVQEAISAQTDAIENLQRLNASKKIKKTGLLDKNYSFVSSVNKKWFKGMAEVYLRYLERAMKGI